MKKLNLIKCLASTIITTSPLIAQVLPLQENSWESKTFQKRFLGSFGVKSEIEPTITASEKELFEVLIPLVQSDKIQAAIDKIKSYMNSAETYSAALDFTLANLYFQGNELVLATSNYEAAVKKFPSFSRAYENLGRINVMRGNYEVARAYLVQALELGGANSDLYGLLGFSYLNQGKPASALVAYDEAALLDPENKDWQLGKAQALVQSERNEEAIALLKELVNRDAGNRNLILSISNAYLNKGEYQKSAAYLEILNRTGNANSASLLLLGDIYMNEGLPDLALPIYEQAMVSTKDRLTLPSSLRVAQVYAERDMSEQANKIIEIIEQNYKDLIEDEDKLSLLNLRSKLALNAGRNDEALSILKSIIGVDPVNGVAIMTMANLSWEQGDTVTAQYYFDRAQKLERVKFSALVDNARMLVQQSEYRKAERLLRRAYDIKPSENLKDYLEAVSQVASR